MIIICADPTNSLDLIELAQRIAGNNFLQVDDLEKIHIKPGDIVIGSVESIQSKSIEALLNLNINFKDSIIITIFKEDALLTSSLSQLGFSNIFILPYEIQKLTIFLESQLNVNDEDTKIDKENIEYLVKVESINSILGATEIAEEEYPLIDAAFINPTLPLFIAGEIGTGKTRLAEKIHRFGKTKNGPFIEFECSALSPNLLEMEIFGEETSDNGNLTINKPGLIEIARNGTLLIKEVEYLNTSTQLKLFKALDKGHYFRSSGMNEIEIDTRIILATQKNLQPLVQQKLFNSDFYNLLKSYALNLLPLRDRSSEIITIAQNLMAEYCNIFDEPIKTFSDDCKKLLTDYNWPGNIRQLKQSIERSVLLSKDETITVQVLDQSIKNYAGETFDNQNYVPANPDFIKLELNYKNTTLAGLIRYYTNLLLEKMNGNKSQTAKALEISRPKLDRILKNNKE